MKNSIFFTALLLFGFQLYADDSTAITINDPSRLFIEITSNKIYFQLISGSGDATGIDGFPISSDLKVNWKYGIDSTNALCIQSFWIAYSTNKKFTFIWNNLSNTLDRIQLAP